MIIMISTVQKTPDFGVLELLESWNFIMNFQVCTAGCVAGDNVTLQPLPCWPRLKIRPWYSAGQLVVPKRSQRIRSFVRFCYEPGNHIGIDHITRMENIGKHGVESRVEDTTKTVFSNGRSLFSGRTGRTLPDGSAAALATNVCERQDDREIREGNWMELV